MSRALAHMLKAYALEVLGFDLAGIAAATPLESTTRLREWVGHGFHAGMGYMAETLEVRGDPSRFLPGARSVVCVAMSYHDAPEEPELAPRGDRVVVARYARRSDYHKVIKRRLVRLGRFLRTLVPAVTWRIGVDEHPLLERDLAERAGLGWIGKNTCLINRRLGSELLLGELVTDLTLPPDPAEGDHCGSCTSCLDACPTRALPIPRLLDARRCISYLTIEHRSELGEDLHRPVGAHLFGCDICQAVCPWNVRARCRAADPLRPRPHLGALRLDTLDRLEIASWDSLVAGTPLRRLSFARFRRNLGIVADNLRQKDEA
ncbi:MAG: tRNA epoxyqueuosine(34) reductase QueG [Acidobacteria bacterium]|nr:tRNA epoxyqueuosine(34) reductase QueG [Acidobacteriota bacterium]